MLGAKWPHRCGHLGELFVEVIPAEVEVGEDRHHGLAKCEQELVDHLTTRSWKLKVKSRQLLDQIQRGFYLGNDEA
jgi:hypothetical protein